MPAKGAEGVLAMVVKEGGRLESLSPWDIQTERGEGMEWKEGGGVTGKGGDFVGRVPVFTLCACGDIFAKVPSHFLEAVADSEDGDVQEEDGGVDVRGRGVVDGVGASGEDDAFRGLGEVGEFLGAGEHLRVDIYFSEAAGDEMGVLGSEV